MSRSYASRQKKKRRFTTFTSISDLPDDIQVAILIKLPVKDILAATLVSSKWNKLIFDDYFADEHLKRGKIGCLLSGNDPETFESLVSVVDPDEFDSVREEIKHIGCKLRIRGCVPEVVNSCHGMVCVSRQGEPVIVWNPITAEFIHIPPVDTKPGMGPTLCGFGRSAITREYKVIRMVLNREQPRFVVNAEVHTIGTDEWRQVEVCNRTFTISFPTYHKGKIYWICYNNQIWCFDIENEIFETSVSFPPIPCYLFFGLALGEIGGKLCLSSSYSGNIQVWTYNDDTNNWSQNFTFQEDAEQADIVVGQYIPMMSLHNGDLLLFNTKRDVLICKDPDGNSVKLMPIQGFEANINAIGHVASFVPMKKVIGGYGKDLKVQHM